MMGNDFGIGTLITLIKICVPLAVIGVVMLVWKLIELIVR